jgi:hypothetical protein
MKIGILFGLYVLIVGNIYGAYKYLDYEVNIFKPRVSDYLLNRFK